MRVLYRVFEVENNKMCHDRLDTFSVLVPLGSYDGIGDAHRALNKEIEKGKECTIVITYKKD